MPPSRLLTAPPTVPPSPIALRNGMQSATAAELRKLEQTRQRALQQRDVQLQQLEELKVTDCPMLGLGMRLKWKWGWGH